VKVTLKASYLVREPGPRYLVHGTEGSFLKHGIDPQEEALKKGELPGGQDWGGEAREEWGRLNTKIGAHNGPYKTLPGNYLAYYENIYQTLTGKAKLEVTAAQANMVIKVIEAAIESSQSGNRVIISG
jgi:predicted dehydrogenase